MRENKEYEIQIEIENACLLNCVHCSSAETRKITKRLYSDDMLVNFLSHIPSMIHVYLTGGDPILYPGIANLCNSISEVKPNARIGLYTTGNSFMMKPISEELANKLACAGVSDCYFSIYHCIPEKHDAFTRCAGSFYNTISSASRLKDTGVSPKAHLVLSKQNYKDIDAIIDTCRKMGFEEVRVLKLTPTGNAKYNWDEIGISSQEQDKVITSLIERKDSFGIRLTFSGYPHLHPCRASTNAYKCQAGTNLIYINAMGDVFPCACTLGFPGKFKLGNIGETHKVLDAMETLYSHGFNESCLNP